MLSRRPGPRAGRHSQSGASAVEYAVILAGVAIAIIGVVAVLQSTARQAYVAAGVKINDTAVPTSGAGAPATSAPATSAPATSAPATSAPATSAPATSAPATSAPATSAPATSTPSASPTRPPGAIDVERGEDSDDTDIGWGKGAKDLKLTVTPSGQGTAKLDGGDLVYSPKSDAAKGAVTVAWEYTKGGKTYKGTVTYWVT